MPKHEIAIVGGQPALTHPHTCRNTTTCEIANLVGAKEAVAEAMGAYEFAIIKLLLESGFEALGFVLADLAGLQLTIRAEVEQTISCGDTEYLLSGL